MRPTTFQSPFFYAAFLTMLFLPALSSARVQSQVLRQIQQKAVESGTEELVIYQNGKVVYKYSKSKSPSAFDEVISVQSITKTMAALSYLMLSHEIHGDLGLKQKLSDFPGFQNVLVAPKNEIEIQHLLAQTSGVVDLPNMWEFPDTISLFLQQPLFSAPGLQFAYSNTGSAVVGPVIDSMTESFRGGPVDPILTYLGPRLLEPLGIKDFFWSRDQFSRLHTSGGVYTSANTLARLGHLFLNRGRHANEQLIEPSIFDHISRHRSSATRCYGLMVWIVDSRCGEIAGSAQESVRPDARRKSGYFMDGFGGQYIIVIPSSRIVVVRTQKNLEFKDLNEMKRQSFLDLPALVSRL